MKKFRHVVNPVKVGPDSDLFVAQPVTFRSMLRASEHIQDKANIELCSIGYEEDMYIVPENMIRLNNLHRSVMDVGNFRNARKLPLIRDILDAAVADSDAQYIIYSNVDISLMPYFYDFICNELKESDALVINRRTIPKSDTSEKPLSLFYSQIGESHPGFDCFIFRKDIYDKFYLGDACIGANWIGRILICNLLAYSDSAKIIEDAHLTFHLGDDRSWKTSVNIEFDRHNENIVSELIGKIKDEGLLDKHPLLRRTYDEFYTKSIDPDPTRPKEVKPGPEYSITEPDISVLPYEYKPSNGWDDRGDNILRQDPVFIVGYPRSGTTLLQSLIATQYTPAIFPETHFFSIVRNKLRVKKDIIQQECLEDVLNFLGEKLVLSENIKKYITDLVESKKLSPKMLFEAIVFDQLSNHVFIDDITNTPWIEKTPDHIEHLDIIDRFYPNTKYIFIIRNPEKAILSRRKHFVWNNESEWPVEKHITKWINTIRYADSFIKDNPDRMLIIKFEDLIADKHIVLGNICQYLGVNYQPEKLEKFGRYSMQQSLPWENWKIDTQNKLSKKVAMREDIMMNIADRKKLEYLSREYLARFKYNINLDEDEKKSNDGILWRIKNKISRKIQNTKHK